MTDTQDTPTPNTEPGGERGDAGPSRRRRKLLPLGIGALIVAGLGVGLWLSYRPVPDQLQGMVDARELRITSKVTTIRARPGMALGSFLRKSTIHIDVAPHFPIYRYCCSVPPAS